MELVKPREEFVAEEKEQTSGPIIWDFVNSILSGKKNILNEETSKNYAPYTVNKAISKHMDCTRLVQEINERHWLDKELHYDFLFHIISKRDRSRVTWFKPDRDKEVELLMSYYSYNKQLAEQVLPLHTETDLENIRHTMRKGGKTTGRKS